MDKEADAFRTISEVAEELRVPQHVLRFWETRFSQIKPMKRGGGRRYYRASDVEFLHVIRILLYDEGYTIKGVQKLLKEKKVSDLLQSKYSQNLHQPEQSDCFIKFSDQDELAFSIPLEQNNLSSNPSFSSEEKPGNGLFNFLKREDRLESMDNFLLPKNALTADKKKILQNVLTELLECKKMLDLIKETS